MLREVRMGMMGWGCGIWEGCLQFVQALIGWVSVEVELLSVSFQ
jgi:hypothetical protein